MEAIKYYLGSGNMVNRRDTIGIKVSKFLDNQKNIIPLFNKFPIIGNKNEYYQDF